MSAGWQKLFDDYSINFRFFIIEICELFIFFGLDSRLRGNDGMEAGMMRWMGGFPPTRERRGGIGSDGVVEMVHQVLLAARPL